MRWGRCSRNRYHCASPRQNVTESVISSTDNRVSFPSISWNSGRRMNFDEEASRMKRKLEEMTTISGVHVDLEPYPSNSSGGWGGKAVDDGTEGGYVWKVRNGATCVHGIRSGTSRFGAGLQDHDFF